ncbi:MAG: hypothetical protein K0Q90_646 [Paenibacillaceae bacterium]|jgi:hypothetical protein|nr:hypothetical protein [Paenibacillaceae bacterium]
MKLLLISRNGKQSDLTALVQRITWSGSIQEAARKLEVELSVSATDSWVRAPSVDLADMLMLFSDGGGELFRGYIFGKSKTLAGNALSLNAYDGMIYLIKSELSRQFQEITAEQVAGAVCKELGVLAGNMAGTGIPQSFPHLGKTGYEAIMTAYTTASRLNGKRYMPRMGRGKLDVVEKGSIVAKRKLQASVHILDSSYGEDLEDMVNTVLLTDEKGNPIGTVSRPDWVSSYGTLQRVYQQEEGKDSATIADGLLQDVSRSASLQVMGGNDALDLIAGNAVQVRESYTGLNGLFYIDEDTHTFENGQHMVSLELNFRNVMDEQEADEPEEIVDEEPMEAWEEEL